MNTRHVETLLYTKVVFGAVPVLRNIILAVISRECEPDHVFQHNNVNIIVLRRNWIFSPKECTT